MDEAGNTGRRCDDPAQPIHLILTLVVEEEKVPVLHQHVRESPACTAPQSATGRISSFTGRICFQAVTTSTAPIQASASPSTTTS